MALASIVWKSRTLNKDTSVEVFVPFDERLGKKMDRTQTKVLFLLHGAGGGPKTWQRFSAVEQYAENRNLLVVMPDGELSFYLNMAYGPRYEDYIAEELPMLVERFFSVSVDRTTLSIAGLSMGGYGALHTALRHKERFGKCGFFSAPLDLHVVGKEKIRGRTDFRPKSSGDSLLRPVLGDDLQVPEHCDLFKMTKMLAAEPDFPKLFHVCGTEDPLYEVNRRFADEMNAANVRKYSYYELPGGHYFDVWDPALKMMLSAFYAEEATSE